MATASFEKLSVVNDSTHKHLIYISENNISNKTDCQKNMTDNAGVLITDPQILDRLKTSLSHPISISLILPTCLLEPTKYREQHSFAKCGVEDTSSANDGGKRQTTSLIAESVVGRLLSTLGHTFFCPPQSDGTNKRARNELKDSTDDVDTKSDSNIPLKRISVDHGMISTKDRPIITYEDDGNGECLEENGLQQGLFPIVADRPLDWSDSQEICAIQDFMDVQLTARLSATNSGTHGNLGLCSAPGKKVRLDVASAEAAALGSRAPVSRDLTLDFQRIVDHQFTAIIK
jgi:hypothetical protein